MKEVSLRRNAIYILDIEQQKWDKTQTLQDGVNELNR